jgi:hypothetical protein
VRRESSSEDELKVMMKDERRRRKTVMEQDVFGLGCGCAVADLGSCLPGRMWLVMISWASYI